MIRTNNTIPINFSPLQHSRVCFFLAVILFLLAAGSVYWHESSHYTIYLTLGIILAVLGLVPLLFHALHHRAK
jgi:Ni,Fe-hydrogenase I cytochrome b subunit